MMINVIDLGVQDYVQVFHAMQHFTAQRVHSTKDELWLVEHPAVYTQGQAGKQEHLLNTGNIPVIQSDRGGQVTYHGPGQLVAYVLFDLKRRGLGVKTLVGQLELIVVKCLREYAIAAETHCGSPGVFVNDAKIASIGLRVKNHCTYHGIALNVAMDLSPFSGINPCGYQHLKMTDMRNFQDNICLDVVKKAFINIFLSKFES